MLFTWYTLNLTGFQRVYAYDMIYILLTAIGLTPGDSSTVYIYTQTIHRTTQQNNTQNIHNNKNIKFTKLNRSIQNIHTYIYSDKKWNQKNMKECDKWKSHISFKLHMIYISCNNGRHTVTKSFTPLQYTSPSYTSLHYSVIWPNPI